MKKAAKHTSLLLLATLTLTACSIESPSSAESSSTEYEDLEADNGKTAGGGLEIVVVNPSNDDSNDKAVDNEDDADNRELITEEETEEETEDSDQELLQPSEDDDNIDEDNKENYDYPALVHLIKEDGSYFTSYEPESRGEPYNGIAYYTKGEVIDDRLFISGSLSKDSYENGELIVNAGHAFIVTDDTKFVGQPMGIEEEYTRSDFNTNNWPLIEIIVEDGVVVKVIGFA